MANLASQLARLKRENAELKEKLRQQAQIVDEDTQFALTVLEQMPITFWACDHDCKIEFWNKHASRLYGWEKEEALGLDFVNLFVDKLEADHARADVVDIIDNGRHMQNIANDRDRFGAVKRLLTICFPVFHPGKGKSLQVEFSFEISNLQILEAEVVQIRERGQKLIDQQELERAGTKTGILRERKIAAMRRVTGLCEDRLRALSDKINGIKELLGVYLIGDAQRKDNERKLAELIEEKSELRHWTNGIQTRLANAKSIDEITELDNEISTREE